MRRMFFFGPQSHANANFLTALSNGESDEAVDSNARKD